MALCRIPFFSFSRFLLASLWFFLLFTEDAESIFGIAKPQFLQYPMQGRGAAHCVFGTIEATDSSRNSRETRILQNHQHRICQQPCFVKNIPKKNGSFDLALRKRRFCNAKQPLLPCKTYAFGTPTIGFAKCWYIDSQAADTFMKNIYAFIACLSCISELPEPPITQKRKTITVLRFRQS